MKSINYKLLILSLLIVFVVVSSCDDTRIDTPPPFRTEEELFNEPGDYFQFTIAMYSKLTDYYWAALTDPNYMTFLFHHLPGDDITELEGNFFAETFQGINPTTKNVEIYYDKLYELIQRSNVLINKTQEGDPGIFSDPEELDWYQGEGYFMRGFAHLRLYLLFGTAPVVNFRVTKPEDANVPRSNGVELLDQAISDLEEAAILLPASWSDENRGRAFKSSANGLLMKAYMLRGDYSGNNADYQSVLTAFQRINDRSLVTNYLDNFSAFTENNDESIFEFQAAVAIFTDNVWLWNDGDNGASEYGGVESMGAVWKFFSMSTNNSWTRPHWRVTNKVLSSFGTDPRIDSLVDAGSSTFLKYGRADLDPPNLNGHPSADGRNPWIRSSVNNPRIMRYAECLLLAAEATLLTNGSVSNAIGYVNQVRARADGWANGGGTAVPSLSTSLSTAEAMDAVQNERFVELCGEEFVRWTDLKRWDARQDPDYDLSTWGGGDNGFSTGAPTFNFQYPKHLLWPLPQTEIDRNGAIIGNNEGY